MADYTKVKASTQDHLDIEDITDDLVILKTGWVAMVLTTTAVNFDILSEAEQDATIYAYGALLNSLSFPVEILVRSKKADITAYFNSLVEAEKSQTNPDLKRQIQKYQDFIQATVQQKTILDKKFYLVITFSPLELGVRGLKRTAPSKGRNKAQLIADAKIALSPKRDHLIGQMARLGLAARQMTTQELTELFYDIYNPAPLGTQRVILDSASYTIPIVQPAVEVPTPFKPEASKSPDQMNESATFSQPAQETPGFAGQAASGELRPVPPPTAPVEGANDALKNLQTASDQARSFVDQTKSANFGPVDKKKGF